MYIFTLNDLLSILFLLIKLISQQVHSKWSSPLSPSHRTSAILPCSAVRFQVTQHLSSAGRRTERTCHRPLNLTPVSLCCHQVRCRSAESSPRTRLHTAVWLITPAAQGRGRTQSSVCSQVTDGTTMPSKHMILDLLIYWVTDNCSLA